jgi:hypothetical protein
MPLWIAVVVGLRPCNTRNSMAMSAGLLSTPPTAMALATWALTAVCLEITSTGTPTVKDFLLGVDDKATMKDLSRALGLGLGKSACKGSRRTRFNCKQG